MAHFRLSDCTTSRAPGRLIRRIDKMMRDILDERLRPLGLSYPQWATLKLTGEGKTPTAGDLAREIDYTTGAVTRLIDSLEKDGLIERTRHKGDRRVVNIAVTASGAMLCEEGKEIVIASWNEMMTDIGQDEANQFVETLVKLQAAVEAKYCRRNAALEAAE